MFLSNKKRKIWIKSLMTNLLIKNNQNIKINMKVNQNYKYFSKLTNLKFTKLNLTSVERNMIHKNLPSCRTILVSLAKYIKFFLLLIIKLTYCMITSLNLYNKNYSDATVGCTRSHIQESL